MNDQHQIRNSSESWNYGPQTKRPDPSLTLNVIATLATIGLLALFVALWHYGAQYLDKVGK